MRITFLNDGYRNCGGCLQLVKYANLMQAMGHEVVLAYTHTFDFDLCEVAAPKVYAPEARADCLPDADAILCSSWFMARQVAALPHSKGVKFAYLQDFENWSGTSEAIIGCWRQPVHLIAVAEYLREDAAKHASRSACVMAYGIDFDQFYPGDKVLPSPERFVIGGLYNAMPRKRFDDLLAVADRARELGVPVSLEIFGAVDRPDCLPRDASYIRLPERATLAAMMRRCHVWLAMSEQEGLHIPPMEAMACGAVPVCTNIGGMRDYCRDGDTGFQVAVGDVEKAANRVLELWRSPETWSAYSKRALAHIRAMGSETENAEAMVALFRARQGEAGVDALFDFFSHNHNTYATLKTYSQMGEQWIENGDIEAGTHLLQRVVRYFEKRAESCGVRNFLGLRRGLYGPPLARLDELDAVQGEESPAMYAAGVPGVLEREAQKQGRTAVARFDGERTFDGRLQIHIAGSNVPWEEWAAALNRERMPVTFTGADPFLFVELPQLINAIDPVIGVAVETALSRDVRESVAAIQREVDFRLQGSEDAATDQAVISRNIESIRKHNRFAVCPCAALAPVPLPGSAPGEALCNRRLYLVGPDGTRFPCRSRLKAKELGMENLFTDGLGRDVLLVTCPAWGHCDPLDGQDEMHLVALEPAPVE